MKKIFITLILIAVTTQIQYAQEKYFVGAEASYIIPLGTLSDRYDPGYGISIVAGERTNSDWNWSGRFEYIRFSEENQEKMNVRRRYTVAGEQKDFGIPVKSLVMDLKAYGLTANLTYDFLDFDFLKAQASVGFGVYRWENLRGTVKDSLFADTTGSGVPAFVEYLDVPENKQMDWSGGFYTGLKFEIPIVDPVALTVSSHYKGIIGELWPALALDKENVSVFQMLDTKVSIHIKL